MLSKISAWRWRRRQLREMKRGLAELDTFDPEAWSQPSRHAPTSHLHVRSKPEREPRRRRTTGPALPGLLITGLLLGGVVAFSPGDDMATLRRIIGMEDNGPGHYAFMTTRPGSGAPVGYSPCRTIEVEINPDGAPSDYRELVDTAIDHVSEYSGLTFSVIGTTTDRYADIDTSDPSRPVLVSWADSEEVPELEGNIAGLGGSLARDQGGRLRYVTGTVTLDIDAFVGLGATNPGTAQSIVDHEFGHLVGLDHVDDENELMTAATTGQTVWGPGDKRGLEILGDLDC